VKALIELGGKGETDAVLKNVYDKVKDVLKPVDKEDMPNSREPRWRLHARYERKTMVMEGLMRADSSYGSWELTPKGRSLIRAR
jgi:Mrr N-terminal domain